MSNSGTYSTKIKRSQLLRIGMSMLLLITFSFSVIRPILPYVAYVTNYDYISTVLCINKDKPQVSCNGTCHLSSELRAASKQDTDNGDKAALLRFAFEKSPIICYSLHEVQWNDNPKELLHLPLIGNFRIPSSYKTAPIPPPPKFV